MTSGSKLERTAARGTRPSSNSWDESDAAAALASRRKRRRDAIVEIALQVFLEGGYSTTSMSTISARVGGSKGTLYNYFASKEELFEAVVQRLCGRNAKILATIKVEGGDFRDALERYGVGIVRLMTSNEVIAMHRLITAEATRFPEIGAAVYQAGVSPTKAKLRDRFEAWMAAGYIRAGDPQVAALHFFELCLSRLYRDRLWNIVGPPSDAEIAANVEAAVHTFMNGYHVGDTASG